MYLLRKNIPENKQKLRKLTNKIRSKKTLDWTFECPGAFGEDSNIDEDSLCLLRRLLSR